MTHDARSPGRLRRERQTDGGVAAVEPRGGMAVNETALTDLLRGVAEKAPSASWGSRVEFVYQSLRTILQSGHLSGGERIREETISQILGVSRTPVRAALQRLQQKGLLDVTDGRSLGVVTLSREQVVELYEMRQFLEGWAARLAAQRASDNEIALLKRIAEDNIKHEAEEVLRARLNRQFHDAIHHASHNRYLVKTLTEIHDAIAMLGRTTLLDRERAHQANLEHQLILAAIEARDVDRAEAAARSHAESAMRMRLAGVTS